MSTELILEIIGTLLSVSYVLLLMANKVWAWPCGIMGSAIMAYSFFGAQLWMETFSYFIYVVMGFYGWWFWVNGKKTANDSVEVVDWPVLTHVGGIITTILFSLGLGYLLSYTSEARPYFDTFTTVFAMLATWMQARKVLSNWLYWIGINLASVYLYWSAEFSIYPWLALLFAVLSVSGFIQWQKLRKTQYGV